MKARLHHLSVRCTDTHMQIFVVVNNKCAPRPPMVKLMYDSTPGKLLDMITAKGWDSVLSDNQLYELEVAAVAIQTAVAALEFQTPPRPVQWFFSDVVQILNAPQTIHLHTDCIIRFKLANALQFQFELNCHI